MSQPTARVLIVDDHDLARAGLRGLLQGERDFEIVGEADTGTATVAACDRLQPDLVLMDVRMPDMDGIAATRAIKARSPQVSVLVFTMQEDPQYLAAAVAAGAASYLLKGVSRRELLAAMRATLRGEAVLPAELAGPALRQAAAGASGPHADASGGLREPLTAREHEVLALVCQGYTNQQIATTLVVSRATVKTHVEHLIRKLDVSDRTQAAVVALQRGLVAVANARAGA